MYAFCVHCLSLAYSSCRSSPLFKILNVFVVQSSVVVGRRRSSSVVVGRRRSSSSVIIGHRHRSSSVVIVGHSSSLRTHPPAEDLVDGGRLLERALLDDGRAHLLHEEHEGVERLLDVRLLLRRRRLVGRRRLHAVRQQQREVRLPATDATPPRGLTNKQGDIYKIYLIEQSTDLSFGPPSCPSTHPKNPYANEYGELDLQLYKRSKSKFGGPNLLKGTYRNIQIMKYTSHDKIYYSIARFPYCIICQLVLSAAN